MSSRQEEKAARRAEREAQEAAARRAANTSKRVQMAFGAFLVIAILGGSTFLLLNGSDSQSTGEVSDAPTAQVTLPPVKIADLADAVAAAKCTQTNPEIEGSTHVTGTVNYKTNPPSSGNHNQVPAEDGVYDPGNEPAKENYVHSLEHGRIEIEYAPGTPKATIDQLVAVGHEELKGSVDYHRLIFQNNTNMPFKVAAVAWGHILGCPAMNPQVIDAIRAFRKAYTDKGPELIP
jgi:hypothetical protein